MTNSLTRNQIKYLAIIAMVIDHVAMFFLSQGIADAPFYKVALYASMRAAGRLTGPVMLFFVAEGFIHTSSRLKYGIRLLIFGLISQIPYALAHYNTLLKSDLNVIITLFVSFLMLTAAEKIRNPVLNKIVVFALMISTWFCDWGVIGPFMVWIFYIFRDNRKTRIKAFSILSAITVAGNIVFLISKGLHWYGELWQLGLFLVVPLLLRYNGQPGKRSPVNKWVFYIIYPLHFLIFWIIRYIA